MLVDINFDELCFIDLLLMSIIAVEVVTVLMIHLLEFKNY